MERVNKERIRSEYGESLVPDLSGNDWSLSPFKLILTMGLPTVSNRVLLSCKGK